MFVVRYSTTIEKDIELGFSCYMGTLGTSVVDALEIDGYDIETLEARYERFGGDESFEEYLVENVVPDSGIIFDERFGAYRSYHHAGLSCWGLEADSVEGAIAEATQHVGCAGAELAQYTIGTVHIVREIAANVYLLECESYANET